jgi:hypothetical protein
MLLRIIAVNLLTDPVADCTKDQTDGSYPLIIFFTRTTPGCYSLSFETQTVTLVDRSSSNLVVTSGVIQIDAITDTQVTGGLHVFNAEFGEINGGSMAGYATRASEMTHDQPRTARPTGKRTRGR